MAKKLAVFVEGQTEQFLVQRLLTEVAGKHQIAIDLVQARGSGTSRLIVEGHSRNDLRYYAIICDCGSDSTVVSDVRDNYATLAQAGYSLVLGLRDEYSAGTPPPSEQRLTAMRTAMRSALPNGAVPCQVILAVREIESWFIVEDWHYPHIHQELTVELIRARLQIDTTTVAAESIADPADTLHRIYQIKGKAYRKTRAHVHRTVDALDYERLYCEISVKVAALGDLCGHLDTFFTEPSQGNSDLAGN